MGYATLDLRRARFTAVPVRTDGRVEHLEEPAAREHFRRTSPEWQSYVDRIDAQRQRRRRFAETAVVERDVPVRRDTGGLLKSRIRVDFVTFGKHRHEVRAGTADAFVRTHAEKKYPELADTLPDPFPSWFAAHRGEFHSWRAAFVTAEATTAVELGLDPTPRPLPDFPVEVAMRELDRLQEEGWNLVHVSEDRGRFAEPGVEEYVARVRYLLSRP
jgi:hypothetical protein